MFREYVELINEAITEGVERGSQMFLENLNQDLMINEVCDKLEGVDNVFRQIFHENGSTITELDAISEDADFDTKLDHILNQLKQQGY